MIPESALRYHLWGYYAARAINHESRFFDFRQEINNYISVSLEKGLDIYQSILEKVFKSFTASRGVFHIKCPKT